MKPRIKLKLLPPIREGSGVADSMAAFAEAADMLVVRQVYGIEVVVSSDGTRWPRALTPLCYTVFRPAIAAMEVRAAGGYAGVAEVVECLDPADEQMRLAHESHLTLADQERQEWEPRFRAFMEVGT